jgi:uncharacterized protein (DUF433 family)
MERIITISPNVQSGAPVFTGTRVPIQNFFDYIRGGDTIDEFLTDFPSVERKQIMTLLNVVENKLPTEIIKKHGKDFA